MNERSLTNQWRRQTIKSGSAFKGQLYFQVGQMAKHRGGRFGKGRRSPSPLGGLWAMPQKNFQKSTLKSRVFCIFCKLKWFHLQRRQGNFD